VTKVGLDYRGSVLDGGSIFDRGSIFDWGSILDRGSILDMVSILGSSKRVFAIMSAQTPETSQSLIQLETGIKRRGRVLHHHHQFGG
jgi:hypothetical protein